MLTRLKVKGFKNLVDLDVRFGPFTCIAGTNGVGKSNLFDAILLLSSLADQSLLEAVTSVRNEKRSADAARIFGRSAGSVSTELEFEAEMLVAPQASDDLDQIATATITALRYAVTLRLKQVDGSSIPRIELVREQLDYIKHGEASEAFPFAKPKGAWLSSVFKGRRTSPFISTEHTDEGTFIRLHEDSGAGGRSLKLRAEDLQRTLLSTINTAESPTALVVRRELQSWRLLQLEPSRLREPDDLKAASRLGEDGSGLAATVYRLLTGKGVDEETIRARLTNRLSELVESVRDVRVDVDEKREILTLLARGIDGVEHRARDLSDGTLRFLALAVLELDSSWHGTLCFEEPENGIHPTRIPAMLELLQALGVDLDFPVAPDNPLRQVIVNTHSPEVASLVPADALLFAVPKSSGVAGRDGLALQPLSNTWRSRDERETVPRGKVLEMLNAAYAALSEAREKKRAVVGTRSDLVQMILPGTYQAGS